MHWLLSSTGDTNVGYFFVYYQAKLNAIRRQGHHKPGSLCAKLERQC
jgi:hypothetical protein